MMYIRVILQFFLASVTLIHASDDKTIIFKIGSLLPEITSLSTSSKNHIGNQSFITGLSISNSIHFASQKLSELFLKEYGCNLKLDLANTKVNALNLLKKS